MRLVFKPGENRAISDASLEPQHLAGATKDSVHLARTAQMGWRATSVSRPAARRGAGVDVKAVDAAQLAE